MKKSTFFFSIIALCGINEVCGKAALGLVNIALAKPEDAKKQKDLIDTMILVGDVPFKGGVEAAYKKAFGNNAKPEGLPSTFYKETDKAKKLDYITDNLVVPAVQGVNQNAVAKFKQKVAGL